MKKYAISTRLMEVEEMTRGVYNTVRGWTIPEDENPLDEGYKVIDVTGHVSWIPLEQYQRNFLQVDKNEKLPSGVSIGPKMVKDFIKSYEVIERNGKTTIVTATLVNGYTITEASSCVDPTNYSVEIGTQICLERIENQIWGLLGFLLQSAFKGFN